MAGKGRTIEEEIRPLIERFVVQLARVLERRAARDLKRRVLDEVRGPAAPGQRRPGPPLRAPIRCYFPGCANVAAPRFGMFCAAAHKGLSAAAKARYRAQRLAAE